MGDFEEFGSGLEELEKQLIKNLEGVKDLWGKDFQVAEHAITAQLDALDKAAIGDEVLPLAPYDFEGGLEGHKFATDILSLFQSLRPLEEMVKKITEKGVKKLTPEEQASLDAYLNHSMTTLASGYPDLEESVSKLTALLSKIEAMLAQNASIEELYTVIGQDYLDEVSKGLATILSTGIAIVNGDRSKLQKVNIGEIARALSISTIALTRMGLLIEEAGYPNPFKEYQEYVEKFGALLNSASKEQITAIFKEAIQAKDLDAKKKHVLKELIDDLEGSGDESIIDIFERHQEAVDTLLTE